MVELMENIFRDFRRLVDNIKVVLLGVSYKANTDDTRNTPTENIVKEFTGLLKEMQSSGNLKTSKISEGKVKTKSIDQMVRDTKAYYCVECGKCTAVCPITRYDENFTPRSIVEEALFHEDSEPITDKRLWDCLTCGQCQPRCPHNIDFSVYCLKLRKAARQDGNRGSPSHDGALHQIMELQSAANLKQRRMEWIPKDAKIKEKGEVLYFVGCQPYYDAYFDHLKVECTDIGKSVLKNERAFNVRAGFSAEDDRLPAYFTKESVEPHHVTFQVDDKELDEVFNF